jgi:hypothetical protein
MPASPELPPEVQHLQRINVLPTWNDKPELKKPKADLERIQDPRLLTAVGGLALELEERAGWLVARGTPVEQDTDNAKKYSRVADVSLTVAGDFTNVSARVGLHSRPEKIPGKRAPITRLGYLSIEVNGTNTALDKRFWTYASISSNVLNLGHPEGLTFEQPSLTGSLLVDAFELRDMLTFVENNAPDAALPQQPYPSHVMHDPVPSVPVAS